MTQQAHEAPPRRRGGRSFRTIALGGAALTVVMVSIAVALYFRFIRYERVAIRHVPADAVTVVRLDVEQAPVYEPVRRHLLPLLGGPESPPEEGDARLFRIEGRSGLHRGDLRELVFAFLGGSPGGWVLALGGIFPASAGNAVLAETLRAEWPEFAPTDDGVAIVHRGLGIAVGRARDRVVLVASSEKELRAALEPTDAHERLGVPRRGPGALAVTGEALRRAEAWPAVLRRPELMAVLKRLSSVTGNLELGERLTLHLVLHAAGSSDAARAASDAVSLMRALRRDEPSPATVLLGSGADRATVSNPDGRTADLALTWEREEVDQGFSLLAAVAGHELQ